MIFCVRTPFYRLLSAIGLLSLYTIILGTQACGQPPATKKQATRPVQVPIAYSTDQQLLAKGQQLFQQNCSACHNFLQKGIGPNLAQVTAEVSPQWLKKFIHNAPAVIASGDARATKLYKEYQQYMPAFASLRDADLHALMSFIHSRQKSAAGPADDKRLGDALKDPIPTKIQKSGLRLNLEKVTTAPATADQVPLARITKMGVLPGASGQKDRQFIVDHRGQLYEMEDNQLRLFMDMNKERAGFINKPGLATGFGSFAFHPEFYRNGLLYTTHTEKAKAAPADFAYADSIKVTLQWVLTEWKMNNPTSPAFNGTGRELFRVNMVSPIHGMQEITFNPLAKPGRPDYGLLYIGIGDGGAAENGFYFICNDNTNIWSSVLRIDPQGKNSRNGRYGIPATNPYANSTNPAVKKEVFCRGFRNPNRICWAPDGKMLITDIGHANAEELNIGIAGADYGWPEREGTFVINHRGKMANVYALPQKERTYTYPVAEYDHDEGNAISGGFVYTGTAIPELADKYIFGDIVNGRVFYVDSRQLKLGEQATVQELDIQLNGAVTDFRTLSGSKKTDLRFGQGLNQDLYLFTKADGAIYKVVGSSMVK
ncbi:hypothetical protein GCM10023187_38270 [Nibrella viscosa]|uniref:Cytochrome c domain-containing protein n=1 Tax=Nibrella viscosa TaxID=1084524 RepID=A0ABP8KQI6_9BACT